MSKQPGQNTGAQPAGGGGEGAEAAKPPEQQYGTFRLDALGVSGTEAMIEAPVKRRLPVQLVVLVVLVAVAGGALYAMRRLGMGPMGAIAEVKIDYDYERTRSGADHKKLLADLNSSHVDHQVPSEQVQKNPFKMTAMGPTRETETTPTVDDAGERARKAAKELQDRIDAALATLKVHTVLSGSTPVARVGEENVRVGDSLLSGLFTVTAIGGRSVDITAKNGQMYTLSLDDDVPGGGKAVPIKQHTAPKPPAQTPAPKNKK